MMQIPKGEENHISPHWMAYINVDDLDASAKKAEKLGAKIIVPPTTVSDYGRFVVLQDPTGASISLWQTLKACD
jgi:predicted enzyme related to lactoylglutathione lyase